MEFVFNSSVNLSTVSCAICAVCIVDTVQVTQRGLAGFGFSHFHPRDMREARARARIDFKGAFCGECFSNFARSRPMRGNYGNRVSGVQDALRSWPRPVVL